MSWELLVSWRYLLAKRKEKFISISTFLSIASITIGVAALIIVLAVMNGFGNELRQTIVGFNYHLYVEKIDGAIEPDSVISKIRRNDEIMSATTFIEGQAIVLAEGRQPRGIFVRGTDLVSEKNTIKIDMVEGGYELKDNELAVGNEFANLLNLSVGDRLSLITGANTAPKDFRIASVFHSGMYEYDANAVFATLKAAKTLFGPKDAVEKIGVRIKRLDIVGNVKKTLFSTLGAGYMIHTWSELNRNLFAAIKLEKILLFIVVTLTIVVGALNIINTLSLLTMEKTKDIGILKALGATRLNIAKIYMSKGLIIGATGSSLGFISGLLITKNINGIAAIISKLTGFELFSKEIYYLDKIPVSIDYADVWMIVFCAAALSFLATLYPACHASKLSPIEALRYE